MTSTHEPAASARRRVPLAVAALLLTLGGGAAGVAAATTWPRDTTPDWTPDTTADASALCELERTRLRALVDPDQAVLYRLHAPGFRLVLPTGAELTREEYLGLVTSGELDYQKFDATSSIDVRVGGDSAVLWYRSAIDVTTDAGAIHTAHESWRLDYYQRLDGRWQLVREQATEVGGTPPGMDR